MVQVSDRAFVTAVKPHVVGHLDRFTHNVRFLRLPRSAVPLLLLPAYTGILSRTFSRTVPCVAVALRWRRTAGARSRSACSSLRREPVQELSMIMEAYNSWGVHDETVAAVSQQMRKLPSDA